MTPQSTSLPGVLLLRPAVFRDPRGAFVETWHRDWLAHLPDGTAFVRHARSTNPARHTLRGLHAQRDLGKLVSVAAGRVLDVIVDLRPGSPTHGEHVALELDADEGTLLWVPADCAHGFLTLTEGAVVTYGMTTDYAPGDELGVRWDDPDLGIDWPAEPAVISERDRGLPSLAEALGRMR